MSLFKQKINIKEILGHIPDEALDRISIESEVDRYCKKLNGKLMFYLLLLGLLSSERQSQRGLAELFTSPFFRFLFHWNEKKKISHSSISERLSNINVSFFEQAYQLIYDRFSALYSLKEIEGMSLQRVDSTLVREGSNLLKEGLSCGSKKEKKMLKYTINYDGMFPSFFKLHREAVYCSEVVSLNENVFDHFQKTKDHSQVYLFDRGQCSAHCFKDMQEKDGLFFVGRLQKNRKLKIVKEHPIDKGSFSHGELILDATVNLHCIEKDKENGKEKKYWMNQEFRVIKFRPVNGMEDIILISNMDWGAEQIATAYRRRWDIEVFFRFIKQELNFSHFFSLNDNGIEVTLYMTMIAAMLVMIYKKENELGYKAAVRRIRIELEEIVIELLRVEILCRERLKYPPDI